MPDCHLHPQFIKPYGIFLPVDHNPFATGAIFPLYKLSIFFRCLFAHKIVNDTQLASVTVASGTQDFIHHLCRYPDLPCIQGCNPILYLPYLLLNRR